MAAPNKFKLIILLICIYMSIHWRVVNSVSVLTYVTHWCYSLMLLTDVTHWCYSLMLLTDVTHWCYNVNTVLYQCCTLDKENKGLCNMIYCIHSYDSTNPSPLLQCRAEFSDSTLWCSQQLLRIYIYIYIYSTVNKIRIQATIDTVTTTTYKLFDLSTVSE